MSGPVTTIDSNEGSDPSEALEVILDEMETVTPAASRHQHVTGWKGHVERFIGRWAAADVTYVVAPAEYPGRETILGQRIVHLPRTVDQDGVVEGLMASATRPSCQSLRMRLDRPARP